MFNNDRDTRPSLLLPNTDNSNTAIESNIDVAIVIY